MHSAEMLSSRAFFRSAVNHVALLTNLHSNRRNDLVGRQVRYRRRHTIAVAHREVNLRSDRADAARSIPSSAGDGVFSMGTSGSSVGPGRRDAYFLAVSESWLVIRFR